MNEIPTILVVDDDPSIAQLLKDFLENEHYQVVTAGDAAEAWARFQ